MKHTPVERVEKISVRDGRPMSYGMQAVALHLRITLILLISVLCTNPVIYASPHNQLKMISVFLPAHNQSGGNTIPPY